MFGLFGSKSEPVEQKPLTLDQMNDEQQKEKKKELKKVIRGQQRDLEKQVFKMEMAKKESMKKLEKECKKGEQADKYCKQIYAKQVTQATKQRDQMNINKAKLQSLDYQIDQFFTDMKMTKVIGQSANIMKTMNGLMNIKEMNQNMAVMQKEMMKMGMMQEMVDDAMDSMNDDVDMGDNEIEIDKLIAQTEQQVAEKEGPKKNVSKNKNQMEEQPQQDDLDDFENRLKNLN